VRGLRAALVVALLCASPAASAHQQSLSYGEVQVSGAEASVRLRFFLGDLGGAITFPWHDPPLPGEKQALSGKAALLVLEGFSLTAGGAPCQLQPGASLEDEDRDGVAITARFLCPREIEALEVRLGLLERLAPGHVHLARVTFAGDGAASAERVVRPDEPSYAASRTPRAGWLQLLRLGVEHIFTGADHLAFLFALLLLGGSLGAVVRIVTAFTVAHSITLALATLQVLSPPSRVIEPLIALSVVFVAVENLWALRRGSAEAALSHRWVLTFAFGLVHGFGFADALRALHLPRAELVASLLSFNLGVEAGQLCVVLLLLPLLSLLRRRGRFGRPEAMLASGALLAFGVYWLAARL
jgi:hydrogenase/urease accessory protein HupE